MTDKKHTDIEQTDQNISHDAAEQVADSSRRRFTKSGLAASSVILTLASKPVLGQWACQSPSGFQSGNVSSHGTPVTCSGLTPGYWGNHPEVWPKPTYDPGTCCITTTTTRRGKTTTTKTCSSTTVSTNSADWTGGTAFSQVFNCTGNAVIYFKYSMMQVIWLKGDEDPYQLGAHIVAAILNAKTGKTPVLTEQAVKDMFNEWAAKGYYEPTAGVQWSASDIVAYLKTTMPL